MPKDEAAQKPKRAIFPSLKFIGRGEGDGAEKFFNLVCLRAVVPQFETCGKRVKTRFHPPLTVMFSASPTRPLSVYLVSEFFSRPS